MTVSVQDSLRSERKLAFRWPHVALVALTLALTVYIDVITGYEVSVFLLYVVPVALATRWMGQAAGLTAGFLATLAWIWADKVSGHAYSHEWFLYINAVNRMFCFVLLVTVIRHVAMQKSELMARLHAFSGEVPVCRQCDRVGAQDGYWRPVESYLTEFGGAQVQHKVCPDCARRAYARHGYRDCADQVGQMGQVG